MDARISETAANVCNVGITVNLCQNADRVNDKNIEIG
jgi:hypothetical protein